MCAYCYHPVVTATASTHPPRWPEDPRIPRGGLPHAGPEPRLRTAVVHIPLMRPAFPQLTVVRALLAPSLGRLTAWSQEVRLPVKSSAAHRREARAMVRVLPRCWRLTMLNCSTTSCDSPPPHKFGLISRCRWRRSAAVGRVHPWSWWGRIWPSRFNARMFLVDRRWYWRPVLQQCRVCGSAGSNWESSTSPACRRLKAG